MKKIMDGAIVDTAKGEEITTRTCYNEQGNPLSYNYIVLIAGLYYLHTSGAGDIFSPADDLELIGDGASLLSWAQDGFWSSDLDLIQHIESTR